MNYKRISDDQRRNQSNIMKGRKQSEEHIRKRFINRINPIKGKVAWNRKCIYNNIDYIAKDLIKILNVDYEKLTEMIKSEFIQTK